MRSRQLGQFISWCRKMQVSGQPGNWSSAIPKDRSTGQPGNGHSAPPKDVGFESPRRSIAGKAGRCRKRGNLKPASKVPQVGSDGATRSFKLCSADGCEKSSRLDDPSPATTEGSSSGVTRKCGRRRGQWMRSMGKPRDALQVEPEGASKGVTPSWQRKVERDDA
jgi:hypothetical protein